MSKQVEDYKDIYNPDDAEEWQIIVKDLKEFIEADSLINIQSQNSAPIVVKHRLSPNNIPPIDKSISNVPQIQLVEVIIVGHCYDQVSFYSFVFHYVTFYPFKFSKKTKLDLLKQ